LNGHGCENSFDIGIEKCLKNYGLISNLQESIIAKRLIFIVGVGFALTSLLQGTAKVAKSILLAIIIRSKSIYKPIFLKIPIQIFRD
jgi:hypothetical protein